MILANVFCACWLITIIKLNYESQLSVPWNLVFLSLLLHFALVHYIRGILLKKDAVKSRLSGVMKGSGSQNMVQNGYNLKWFS